METTVPIAIALAAAVLLCVGAVLDDRRARVQRRRDRDEPSRALPLLHSINDDRCIGCEACVDVCPTEVLDLVHHKVRVARFSDCVQCEQCANACPTQALVMFREGTTPRMLTVPELDEHFQTGVPGQYLIGEVAGKPLVKNAANLGRAVVEHLVRERARRPAGRDPDLLDVVIVGSGPGGLSAGLTCQRNKLSCIVLEKEHVISATVSRYPKGKHFMAEPSTAHNVSYLPVFNGTKEELVAAWKQVIDAVKLPIRLGEAVETVTRGDDGVFTVASTVATYRARAVVLATGLRGKPRLLAVPGANLEKVQSLLDDPAEFAGEDVLVVGGGDSAVEGAIALAEAGARVALSYRGDGFKRCKPGNQKRLAEMIANHRLAALLGSNVVCFTPDRVTIALADGSETTIPNQRAFVLIGADTPVAWLEANRVRFVERPHLYALGSSEDVVRRLVPDAQPCPPSAADAIALVLDRPRSPAQRVRSIAQHVRDEIRDVVTSVSAVFRLSELEPPARRAATRPSAHAPHAARDGVVPASRLTAGPSSERTGNATPVRARDTEEIPADRATDALPAIRVRALGSSPGEADAVPPAPPRRLRSATDAASAHALADAGADRDRRAHADAAITSTRRATPAAPAPLRIAQRPTPASVPVSRAPRRAAVAAEAPASPSPSIAPAAEPSRRAVPPPLPPPPLASRTPPVRGSEGTGAPPPAGPSEPRRPDARRTVPPPLPRVARGAR